MHALENRTQLNYESSEGVAIFVTEYSIVLGYLFVFLFLLFIP